MKVTTSFGTVKIVMLKGEKGDKFEFEDYTPEELESLRGEKGDAFTYDDFTEEQLTDLRSSVASAYYRKIDATYRTIGDNTETIPIPIEGYTSSDMLLIDVEGLALTEGEDYTIDGSNIVLATPITHNYTAVNFRAIRAFAITTEDYDSFIGDLTTDMSVYIDEWLTEHPEATTTVQDGSITNAKLAQTGGVLSEVSDISTGTDGTVYPSAGDAVRGQVGKLSGDMADLATAYKKNEYLVSGFELGRFDVATGAKVDTTTQCRTVNRIYTKGFKKLKINSFVNTFWVLWKYDDEGVFVDYEQYTSMTIGESEFDIDCGYINVSIGFQGGLSSISDVVQNISITLTNKTIDTINAVEQITNIVGKGVANLYDLDSFEYGRFDLSTGAKVYTTSQKRTAKKFTDAKGLIVEVKAKTSGTFIEWRYNEDGSFVDYIQRYLSQDAVLHFRLDYPIVNFSVYLNNSALLANLETYLEINVYADRPKYSGKTYSVLGDSLSTFSGVSVGDNPYYPRNGLEWVTDTWWKKVENLTGMILDTNNSLSSSCVSGHDATYTPMCSDSRLSALGTPDVVFIAGGTNDIYANMARGTWNGYDVNTLDCDKFYEAFTKVVAYIQNQYGAEVICISPSFIDSSYSGREYCTIENIDEICGIEKDVCDKMGAKFVDLRKAGLTEFNFDKYTIDHLHWNYKLTSKIADAIYSMMQR